LIKNTPLVKSIFELTALLTTAVGRFIVKDNLEYKLIFMITAGICWFSYFLYTYRTDKLRFKNWGLSFHHFNMTFRELLPFLIVFIMLSVGLGYYLETSILSRSIIPALIVYPVWGILQQTMVLGLFTFNVKQIFPDITDRTLIVLTALTFSLIHYPSKLLMPGTFIMALVYTFLYLRGRNLLVFGIFHGWMGAFFYYCIYQWNSFMAGIGRF
jgi:uncharacterized protein